MSEILALISEHSGEAASLGAAWLRAHAGDGEPKDIAQLVGHLRAHNVWLDETVCNAIEAACKRLSPSGRAEVLERLLVDRFSLPGKILSAVGFTEIEDNVAIDLLAERMRAAGRNSERKEVLDLSGSRRYASRTARSRYVSTLIIPLFSLGIEATTNALDALGRFGKPFPGDMREDVLSALKPAVEGNDKLMKRATETLAPLGFATKGRGPFGLGGRVLKFND